MVPALLLDAEAVTALVGDAVAAPSMHNAQPWLFRHQRGSNTLLLRMDASRTLPAEDPSGRGLHVGCGAALFNLRVAAAHGGREATTTLLPDPADPELLAVVTLVPQTASQGDLAALHPAVHRRHSSRRPFTGEQIPATVLDGLCGAARAEGVRLVFPDAWHAQTILELAQDARALEAASPETLEEVARWTSRAAPGEGIPADAFGPPAQDGRAVVRDFAASPQPAGSSAVFERAPCLALLGTREDGPLDWLLAGQGLQRVLLQATLDGLAATLNSQALEWPELRWAVRDPLSSMGHVQMLLRFGYGPEGPATPRRPVSEVLTTV
ncbi:Acg family FMN-binding oxidoreductase [Streptomyces odontomachi]|uniref:Acg family FMN-binding oxidoreductase n=1 Tax=Streptomyces odontomachi TaxID=2944940 RepID=UPI00210F1555|nr:nitroreductase [Streptomyces sp. ODS25]